MLQTFLIYAHKPKHFSVAQSAWDTYVQFRAEMSDRDAQERILDLHLAHVRRLLAADKIHGDGAVIVTDIPDFDLALVDAHFPTLNERQVTLFSKAGATVVMNALARKRSDLQSLRNFGGE